MLVEIFTQYTHYHQICTSVFLNVFRLSIGVKLLRKMGWKEGQGLGPRISKKQRKLQSKLSYRGPLLDDDIT